MKFNRVSNYAELSECGRYTVCAAKVIGRWTFQGWLRANLEGHMATLLTPTRLTFSQDAKLACERHADRAQVAA